MERREFRGGGGFNRGGPRGGGEMHDATCSQCQKACKVPFKPAADREVFCLDCFKARRNQ